MRALTVALALSLLNAGCAGAPKLMDTPNLHVASMSDPFAEVPFVLQSPYVNVVYATDRASVLADDGSFHYGRDRSPSLAVGECRVRIGDRETWKEIVAACRVEDRERPLWLSVGEIVERARFAATPNRLVRTADGLVVDEEALAADRAAVQFFHDTLRDRLADTPRKEAFVFVHGVSNEFEDAAFHIAEIWHIIGRVGVPVAYTWPAGKNYAYDRESSEFTIHHFKTFLRALAACPELEKIHLIAHSRGTDVVTTGLRELVIEFRASGRDLRRELKVGQMVLLAADLDFEVVNQRTASERVFETFDRLTIYVSEADLAIRASGLIFRSRERLGTLRPEDFTPEQRERLELSGNIDIVRADVSSGFLGHSYFEHPAASSDLVLLLRDGRPPGAEHGRPLTKVDAVFWSFDDDYMKAK